MHTQKAIAYENGTTTLGISCCLPRGPTLNGVERPLAVFAVHEGDEAAVLAALTLLVRARPHDLDARQRPVLAEQLAQLLLGHLKRRNSTSAPACN